MSTGCSRSGGAGRGAAQRGPRRGRSHTARQSPAGRRRPGWPGSSWQPRQGSSRPAGCRPIGQETTARAWRVAATGVLGLAGGLARRRRRRRRPPLSPRSYRLGGARCAGPGGLAWRPQRDLGGPQPTQGGLLADPVALADLGGAQPFGHIQPDKLLTAGCLAGTARPPPRDTGILQPASDRRRCHPVARRQLSDRQAVGDVAAAQLRRGRGERAPSALGLGSQRDPEPPQPSPHGAAADPEPLGDLGRGPLLLLIEPAQLGRRDPAGHPTAHPWSPPEGVGTQRPSTPQAVLVRPISRPAGSRSRPSPRCTPAPPLPRGARSGQRPGRAALPCQHRLAVTCGWGLLALGWAPRGRPPSPWLGRRPGRTPGWRGLTSWSGGTPRAGGQPLAVPRSWIVPAN